MDRRTCKDCRWWAINANGNPNLLPLAVSACKCPKLQESVIDVWGRDGAGVDDGDGVFVTGPDFGCVHFAKVWIEP